MHSSWYSVIFHKRLSGGWPFWCQSGLNLNLNIFSPLLIQMAQDSLQCVGQDCDPSPWLWKGRVCGSAARGRRCRQHWWSDCVWNAAAGWRGFWGMLQWKWLSLCCSFGVTFLSSPGLFECECGQYCCRSGWTDSEIRHFWCAICCGQTMQAMQGGF